ncbi:MAG TPA: hypothetical protein VK869_04435 [Rubrobacteraceae bacterium]|nr:hypothetical protein [Rubrobacteraceae bacterium]
MTSVVEHIGGRYEVYRRPYGTEYAWCPQCIVVECECGGRPELNASETTCRCGVDHTALIDEELASRRWSEAPSRPLDREWREHRDEYLRSEFHDRMEWSALE